MAAIITKKPEAPKTPQAPEQSKDLSAIFKKREGKGAFHYISDEKVHITATIIGTVGKKIHDREKAGRPVRDLGDFLLSYFPSQLVDELEALGVTLEQAYDHLRKSPGGKVSNYSKKMSPAERLARLVAGVAGTKSPEELFEELLGLIKDHRSGAEAMLVKWEKENGRSPKGNVIRVNGVKTK